MMSVTTIFVNKTFISLCWHLSRQRAEEFLQQSDADESHLDIEPCNSYLRKLIYQVFQHRWSKYIESDLFNCMICSMLQCLQLN